MATRMSGPTAATIAVVLVMIAGAVAAVLSSHRSSEPQRPPVSAPTASSSPTPGGGSPAPRGGPSVPADGLTDPTGETCVRTSQTRRLQVLTYNIHAAVGSDGRVHLDSLLAEIRQWRPDVVLLQEVDRFQARTGRVDTPATLAERLGWSWTFGGNLQRGQGHYGNAILSRFPIVDSTQLRLPSPAGTEPRGLLHATVQVGGSQVSVYATHLEHSSPAARMSQARTILGQLRSDPLPVILGGDMNAQPTSPAIATLGSQLHDTWLEVGRGPGRSVPRARIDYLMHRDGDDGASITAQRAEVLPSAFSDHDPVWASYRLRSRDARVCVPAFTG